MCPHKVVCYHCMRRKDRFAVVLSRSLTKIRESLEPPLEPRRKNRVTKNRMALRILLF